MSRVDEIRQRASEATPGRWHWAGNTQSFQVRLMSTAHGRPSIMEFFRWGMRDAKPAFNSECGLVDLQELVVYQVAPGAKRGDRELYREDFFEIDHPDAQFIAHARDDIDFLLSEIDRLEGVTDES